MTFILILFAIALLMEGIGTWLSIVGFGSLFSNDLAILFMIGIMDAAKLGTVSFCYQYWRDISKLTKSYMTVATLILMLITSVGTFGYLSQAFQKAVQPAQEVILKVEAFKHEKASLDTEATQLTDQKLKISEQVARLPDNVILGRQRLINSFKPEQARINSRLEIVTKRSDELNKEILAVENENITRLVHVGPISYVAKAFNITMEEASKYIILTIIFVFDPLAVMLVIAGNFLVLRRRVIPKEIVKPEPMEGPVPGGIKIWPEAPILRPTSDDFKKTIPGYHDVDEFYDEVDEFYKDKPAAPREVPPSADDKTSSDVVTETVVAAPVNRDKQMINKLFELADEFEKEPAAPIVNDLDKSLEAGVEKMKTHGSAVIQALTSDEAEAEAEQLVINTPGGPRGGPPLPEPTIDVAIDNELPVVEQEELIDEQPMHSQLEDITVNLPEALYRLGARTYSIRKFFYEKL